MLVLIHRGGAKSLVLGVAFWVTAIFLVLLCWPIFQYFPTWELIGLAFLVALTFAFLREGRPRLAALSAVAMLVIGLHGYSKFHAAKSIADYEAASMFMASFESSVARDAHLKAVEPEVWRGADMERALKSLASWLGRDIDTSDTPVRAVWTSGKLYADQECEDVREWSFMLHEPGVAHRKFHFDRDRMAAQPKAVKDTVLLERTRFTGVWGNCFSQIAW